MKLPEINFGIAAGETVAETGLYRVFHDGNHATIMDVVCIKDEVLPQCKECGAKVRFMLRERMVHALQYDLLEPLPDTHPKA